MSSLSGSATLKGMIVIANLGNHHRECLPPPGILLMCFHLTQTLNQCIGCNRPPLFQKRKDGLTEKLVDQQVCVTAIHTLPFKKQTKQHVIMLFLFRAVGLFEAT